QIVDDQWLFFRNCGPLQKTKYLTPKAVLLHRILKVPNRFLEVAEITLHEFYNAISAAKDSDSSWKKAIYKVICKLDSEIPEEFKTSSYL
ncbi:Prospero homeobox protein 1, partial [Ataeniobius toweri]|nr:Prospero homeobox protein 1 [Ataeniobius toweri]